MTFDSVHCPTFSSLQPMSAMIFDGCPFIDDGARLSLALRAAKMDLSGPVLASRADRSALPVVRSVWRRFPSAPVTEQRSGREQHTGRKTKAPENVQY